MLVSTERITKRIRWLLAGILLMTSGLMRPGVARAQDTDFEAVGKRLRSAIEAGELTGPQARAMLDVLKRMSDGGDEQTPEQLAFIAELRAKVESGELTGDEARKLYFKKYSEKARGERGGRGSDTKARGESSNAQASVRERLGKLVQAGKLNERKLDKFYEPTPGNSSAN